MVAPHSSENLPMAKSKNRSWIKQHVKDPYVKQSQVDGYRSRASYKLLEIVEKDRLIRSGMTVVDLGSAPGGWSQVAARLVGHTGRVHALDLLPMDSIAGVDFIQGDFTEEDIFDELLKIIENRPVDLVISDMAPNLSGMREIDQPMAIYLTELALEFACSTLRPGGALVMKCFEGSGVDEIREVIRNNFKQLNNFKPKASRGKSREIYVLGRKFKGSLI